MEISTNKKIPTSKPQKKGSTAQPEQIRNVASGVRDSEEIAEVIRQWIVPALVKAFLAKQANRSVSEKTQYRNPWWGEAVSAAEPGLHQE